MVTVRGRDTVNRFFAELPKEIETKLLRGAGRAGGKVIADDARERALAEEIRDDLVLKTSSRDGRIVVKITVKPGWGYSLGVWQEWGTEPHFIRVAENQRQGRSIGRINQLAKAGSLVIGGRFVGETVHHPGARPSPFLRPALDLRGADAIAAAQAYINSRIAGGKIVGAADPEDEA
ncbi:HK97 gp10 family phage protein [Sphingomonas sp.]|uniref:HK97 gp10 family phage protein n=1 Tax=Sphingomonas sp. TaxID=28214 RepID=UPI0028A88A63|nr:HK97 gp10 family phage protein [Sphingomonas sp.]